MGEVRHLLVMGLLGGVCVFAGFGVALFLLRGEIVQNPWTGDDRYLCFVYRNWERRAAMTSLSMDRLCTEIEGRNDHAG